MDVERYGQDNPKRVEAARYEEHLVEAERLLAQVGPKLGVEDETDVVLLAALAHATVAQAAATALTALCT